MGEDEIGSNELAKARYTEDDLVADLQEAHDASLRALNALYSPSGVKRGFWYRVALGRAQSALISLYKQELQRRGQRGNHREP